MAQAEEIVFVSRFDDSQLDAAFKRFTGSIDKAQDAVGSLSDEIDKAMKDATRETEAFNKELAKTEKAATAPAKAITQTNTAIDGFIKRNEMLAASIEELERAKKRDGAITEAQTRKLENARKEIEENNAAIKRMSGATAESTKETLAQGNAATATGKRLVSFSSILRDIVTSGGDVRGVLQRAREEMELNGQSAGSLFKGFSLLSGGATLLAGALVAITGAALAAYFTKSKEGAESLGRTLAGLKEEAGVVTGRFIEFGESLVQVFQGTAKQGAVLESLTRIFTGYGDELSRARERGEEFYNMQLALNEATAFFTTREGRAIGEINKYRDAVDDSTLSVGRRIDALNKAGVIERKLEARRIELAEQELAAIEAKNRTLDGGIKDINEVYEAERRVIDLRNEAAARERADAATLRQIREERAKKLDEERKKVEALNKAYQNLLDRLSTQANKAGAAGLTGLDLIKTERDIALTEFDKFIEEIRDAARAAGVKIAPEVQQQIDEVVAGIQREFAQAFGKLTGEELGLKPVETALGDGLEQAANEAFKRLGVVFSKPVQTDTGLTFSEQIQKSLGLDEEGLKSLAGALSISFSNFVDGLNAATEAQISAQDRIIERRREQVDELQELLDIELQRDRDGFANSVGARERELAEKQGLLEAAEKKRAALEEKAARRTLIINSVQQASEATLTIARLLSASAKLGIFGFIAAAAVGVSTVFSILAQAKAQSAKFAQAPGFKDGTPFVTGPGNSRSDSVPAFLSVEERVVDAKNNARVPRGLPNDVLINYALSGMERERETAEEVRRRQANIDGHKYARDAFAGLTRDDMAELMREVVNKMDEIPKHYYGADGSKVVERKKGGKVIRQTVKATK